jgi:hypothetical protein
MGHPSRSGSCLDAKRAGPVARLVTDLRATAAGYC